MQVNGHTSDWTGQTVERVRSNGKRMFVPAFKAWLVGQARRPGMSVAGLALRHGVNANQLRRWIQLAKREEIGAASPLMLPVHVVAPSEPHQHGPSSVAPSPIEIEVGGAIVRVREGVDVGRLRAVLEALRP